MELAGLVTEAEGTEIGAAAKTLLSANAELQSARAAGNVQRIAEGEKNVAAAAKDLQQKAEAAQQALEQNAPNLVKESGKIKDAKARAEGAGGGSGTERDPPLRDIAKRADAAATPKAGSIRNVNPKKGTTNCVNCVVATDATLRGNPASALPGQPTSIAGLEKYFNSKFQPASLDDIEEALLKSGNGAAGVVYGYPPEGSDVGHVFNAVNQGGTIRFLDGQAGTLADTAPYPQFLFMPVTSIGAP